MTEQQKTAEAIEAYRAARRAQYYRTRDKDPERQRAVWRAAWQAKQARGITRGTYKRSADESLEAGAARKRARYARDPEPFRQRDRQRYEWLKSGDVTTAELRAIWDRAGGQCHYCGEVIEKRRFYKSAPRGFDHIISRTRGGEHTASNIVVCCQPCNSKKGAETGVPADHD